MKKRSLKPEQLTGLYYCSVKELEWLCEKLGLSDKGVKGDLIERIKVFLCTGVVTEMPEMPLISRAKKGKEYPLAPSTLILSGNFKNDLKTRNFMKSLVGPHFHYTSAGLDWIKDRWHAGNPPTYQEFATFWQKYYSAKKGKGESPLKKEWAYLTFVREYLAKHSDTPKALVMKVWKEKRAQEVKNVIELILG